MQNMLIQGQADTAAPLWRESCKKRWGFDPLKPVSVETPFGEEGDAGSRYVTGEEMLYMVADNCVKGNPEDAARKILQDYRAGRMGSICLQVAPVAAASNDSQASSDGSIADFSQVPDPRMGTVRTDGMGSNLNNWEVQREQQEALERERIQTARETAKERGLELPPQLETEGEDKKDSQTSAPDDVGKGLFDGW